MIFSRMLISGLYNGLTDGNGLRNGRLEGLAELNQRIQFGEGFAAIEGFFGFLQRRLEIACFSGQGASRVEQNGIAASTVQFVAKEVAHHHSGFVWRATA